MIYIKDKSNRTQIFVPRQGDVVTEYVTTGVFNDTIEEIAEDYATKDYVNDAIGAINNELENILN